MKTPINLEKYTSEIAILAMQFCLDEEHDLELLKMKARKIVLDVCCDVLADIKKSIYD